MNENSKVDPYEYLNLEELGKAYIDSVLAIQAVNELNENLEDSTAWQLIQELCERSIIKKFSWNPKDVLQFKVKRNG